MELIVLITAIFKFQMNLKHLVIVTFCNEADFWIMKVKTDESRPEEWKQIPKSQR